MPAKISHTPAGGVILRFPFSQNLIEALKCRIPKHCRSYDPGSKAWRISVDYADRAMALFFDHFPDAEIEYLNGVRHSKVPALPGWCRVLYVLPGAPDAVIKAAFRALSREHHPDFGGSHERMVMLNQALEEARRTR